MSQSAKEIAEGLARALQTESDGYHFYTMAARTIQDEKGRRIFETLAQEENAHFRYLKAQYDSYTKTGQPDPAAELPERADLSGENPIFSEGIRSRISDAHFEMTALSIGMQLELSSQRFYTEQAKATSDPKTAEFYRELADWESEHYHALSRQNEALKEEYWSKGGFAPF